MRAEGCFGTGGDIESDTGEGDRDELEESCPIRRRLEGDDGIGELWRTKISES